MTSVMFIRATARRFALVFLSAAGLVFVGISPSSHVAVADSQYLLPYDQSDTVWVSQGNGQGDHQAPWSEWAIDFAKSGTQSTEFTILASRAGTVTGARGDSSSHCTDGGCWRDANYVVVDHGDGTAALYLHLKMGSVLVRPGDAIAQGQQIATADNSGWSTGTHLHFQVEKSPCRSGNRALDEPCRQRPGWWFSESAKVNFYDRDVVAKAPGGVLQSQTSYVSDNRPPVSSPRPVVDRKNATYAISCGGIVPGGMKARLVGGSASVPRPPGGPTGYDHFDVSYEAQATGDVTGDHAPETAVLLYCSPQPSNFVVEEVQIFSFDNKVMAELPSGALQGDSILPPQYVPSELKIKGGVLTTGMMFYRPTDSHASGPSLHRTITWRWKPGLHRFDATNPATPPGRLADARLTLDGLGPLGIGMTLDQAQKAIGRSIQVHYASGSACGDADIPSPPSGLRVMFSNQRLVRIDVVGSSHVATRSGIHLGSTEQDVMRTYPGRITVEPDPIAPDAHWLVFTPHDQSGRLLIFETDETNKVVMLRDGEAEAVRLAEGCRSATDGYRSYTNTRYGFTVQRPAVFLTPARPQNEDGIEWSTDRGSVTLAAFGSNNVNNLTPAEILRADSQGLRVTYTRLDGRAVTVSGTASGGTAIVYIHDLVGAGSINTIRWTYPAEQKQRWDASVTYSAATFRPGDLSVSH